MEQFGYWFGILIGQIANGIVFGASGAFGVYLTVWLLS